MLSETGPLLPDEAWLHIYGPPLVQFRDSRTIAGFETYARLVLYEGGTKLDYTLWSVELLQIIAAAPTLPDELDVGFRVLVDKDGLTAGLNLPTYTAHTPRRPSEAEYLTLVEEFWWETSYVAKNLWRDELFPARYSFDTVIKFDLLRRLLEWSIEIAHGWTLKPGNLGRGLKQQLPQQLWAEIERTFIGADITENWDALFRTTALFRNVAAAVATSLGYTYPQDLDRRMTDYLRRIAALER